MASEARAQQELLDELKKRKAVQYEHPSLNSRGGARIPWGWVAEKAARGLGHVDMYNQMIIAFPYPLRRHVEDGRKHLTTIHRILLLLGEVNQQQPTAAGTARQGLPAGARLCNEVLRCSKNIPGLGP